MLPTKLQSDDKGSLLTSQHIGGTCDIDTFVEKQVFLDVRDYKISAHIEGILKSLGATVHIFFVEDVNLIITDRKGWIAECSGVSKGPGSRVTYKPSWMFDSCSSASPAFHSWEDKEELYSKSRVEEMLKRVKDQPTQVTIDPLDIAAEKGIIILSLEEAWQQIRKISNSAVAEVRHLKSPFVKVDALSGDYQPVLKEFQVEWPTLKINGSGSPFVSPNNQDKESRLFGPATAIQPQPFECKNGTENHSVFLEVDTRRLQSDVPSTIDLKHDAKFHVSSKQSKEESLPYTVETEENDGCANLSFCTKKFLEVLRRPVRSREVSSEKIKKWNFDDVSEKKIQNCSFAGKEVSKTENSHLVNNVEKLKHTGFIFNIPTNTEDNVSTQIIKISVKLTDKLNYSTFLQMPIRPPRSGKLYVFLPDPKAIRQVGEIHVLLHGENEPRLPEKTFLVQKTSFEVDEFTDFSKGFQVVTGGSRCIFEDTTTESSIKTLQCSHGVFRNEKLLAYDARNVETKGRVPCAGDVHRKSISVNVSLKSADSIVEKLLAERYGIVIKVSLQNNFNAPVNCVNVCVYARHCEPYSQEYQNILVPQLNLGILEVVISFVRLASETGQLQEWCKVAALRKQSCHCELESSSNNNILCRTLAFRLVFSERCIFDETLQTALQTALDLLLTRVKDLTVKCEFELQYPVKVFDCTEKLKEIQDEIFKIPKVPVGDILEKDLFKKPGKRISKTRDSPVFSATKGATKGFHGDLLCVSPSTRDLVDPVHMKSKKSKFDKVRIQMVERPMSNFRQKKSLETSSVKVINTNKWIAVKKSRDLQSTSVPHKKRPSRNPVRSPSNVPGYCEICSCDYTNLTKHETESSHRNFFVKTENFYDLDQYISEVNRDSTSVLKKFWVSDH